MTGTTAIDLVIGVTVLEAVLLTLWHQRTGRGVAPAEWRLMLGAGLCLMLALRTVLMSAPFPLTLLFLAAAGIAHLADLKRRWHS